MPYNLTGVSPTYNATGKFGASLNGGTASIANPIPTNGIFTVALWVKAATDGTLRVALGAAGTFWLGMSATGVPIAKYGSSGEIDLTPTSGSIGDNAWHLLELCLSGAGGKFFVDGALVKSSATTMAASGPVYTAVLEFRKFGVSYVWTGEIDDAALYSTANHSTAYTPNTAAISDGAAGLLAVWHLDSNLNDTATGAAPATAVTMTGPTTGTTGSPSSNYTVGADGVITGTVIVTPSDGGAGGTFTPTTVSISSGSPTGTFTYTAATSGAKTISATNNGSLTNPTNITYTASSAGATAVTNTGPTTGTVGSVSSNFTIAANGVISGTVVVTPSDSAGGGTFSPTTVSISSGSPSATFTYTAASAGAKTISVTNNGSLTNPSNITYTASAAANNALVTANALFSPANWNLTSTTAKTINAGAYFKTIFGGTTCTLNFDVSALSAPLPQLSYRIDGFGAWITVPIAATVALTIPSETSDYANKPGHLLEFVVKSESETVNRWATQSTATYLTGIILDTGKVLTKPAALPLNIWFYGDSITEGVRTVNMTGTNDTDRNDSMQSWSLQVGRILGAEVGNIGFGRHGFTVTGNPDVPIFGSTYNLIYAGISRSFAVQPDAIVINMGTNDGTANIVSACTGVLNGLLAATTTTKIIVLRPFKDTTQAANLQSAIAACTAPARCTYVDTAGFFTSANSADALHPYGVENITHIAPLVAASVKSILAGTPTLTTRTVSLTLKLDATTLGANLTGLSVSFWDEPAPNLTTTARYQSAAETTDASGVLTFPVNSTLASGGTGYIDIRGSGLHYCAPVVVA